MINRIAVAPKIDRIVQTLRTHGVPCRAVPGKAEIRVATQVSGTQGFSRTIVHIPATWQATADFLGYK